MSTEIIGTEQLDPTKAYIENMQRMQMVVARMKEIPELPSEVPHDVHPLRLVEFPEEGGVLTHMDGYDAPYRGFPFYEFVDKIDLIKKISRAFLSGMYHGLKDKKWRFITFIPSLWAAKLFLRVGVFVFYRVIERFRIKRVCFSQPIRELHRAMTMSFSTKESERTFQQQLRDLTCMVLEFDNAYRYRFQDVIVEVRQESCKKHVISECVRLLGVLQSREKTVDISDTWKLVKLFFSFYLRFDRSTRKFIEGTLTELKKDEVKLSEEDKFFCKPRKDYTFGFMK